MSEVVLGGDGRAVIHNQRTGQEMFCSVPTAFENIANSGGIWAHGYAPAGLEGAAAPAHAPEPEPVIALVDPDHLPLPAAEDALAGADDDTRAAIEGRVRPVSDEHVHVPAHDEPHPLDHDGDGKKGGAKRAPKAADPERVAVIAALKAAKIKFFAGASTEKLKTLLPA